LAHDGDDARGQLDAARERLLRRHVTATYVERSGEVGVEIIEAARVLNADLVVVGRREPHAVESVSAQIVRNAPGDVLVVR
jgi:nucleotide-binding universal stress UspA family protein